MSARLTCYADHSRPQQPWEWVGDVRRMGAVAQAVQDWQANDGNPRASAQPASS